MCAPGLFVDGWQGRVSSDLGLTSVKIRCSKPSVKLAGSDKSVMWLDFEVNDSKGSYSTQYYETEKYIHEISMTVRSSKKEIDGIELKFRDVECGKGSLLVKAGDLSI